MPLWERRLQTADTHLSLGKSQQCCDVRVCMPQLGVAPCDGSTLNTTSCHVSTDLPSGVTCT